MKQDELIELLRKHEWRDVEFEEAQRKVPRDAYETVSAVAASWTNSMTLQGFRIQRRRLRNKYRALVFRSNGYANRPFTPVGTGRPR